MLYLDVNGVVKPLIGTYLGRYEFVRVLGIVKFITEYIYVCIVFAVLSHKWNIEFCKSKAFFLFSTDK